MNTTQTKGLILFNRDYKEEDLLVKIFTEEEGKRMFFVKRAKTARFRSSLEPLTLIQLQGRLNREGLSYINDTYALVDYGAIKNDIFKMAHASYLLALADASLEDGESDSFLFQFLVQCLDLMEKGLDEAILTNIFEVQLLHRFGVQLDFQHCAICQKTRQAFDFSFAFSGVLCPEHYARDSHRLHLDPNVPYLLGRFQEISIHELETIDLKDEIKEKIRNFLDRLYDDYVGLHLRAKKFLDDLASWGDIMKGD